MRYAELMTLLSIFTGTVHINLEKLLCMKKVQKNVKCELCFWMFNSKFKFRKAMHFAYLEALGNALWRNSKEIYCRSDITDQILKDNWFIGKICAKYGGTSFTYGFYLWNFYCKTKWVFVVFPAWNFTFYHGF